MMRNMQAGNFLKLAYSNRHKADYSRYTDACSVVIFIQEK